MKSILYLLVVVLLASCSSNKYAAHFQNVKPYEPVYAEANPTTVTTPELRPAIQPEQLEASLSAIPVVTEAPTAVNKPVYKTYLQMTKSERKELRQNLKAQMKAHVKAKKAAPESTQAAKGIDNDLKLAAIFGAVGLVALIIGGDVFWIIGGIAMIIGVVFFVKWLIRQ